MRNDNIKKQLNWNEDTLQKLQKNDDGVLTKKISDKTSEGNKINALSEDNEFKLRHEKIFA